MNDVFKVVVAGSRNFKDYDFLKFKLDKLLEKQTKPIEIVSGGARGADSLGEKYANWNEFGKSAGMIRNSQMRDYSDALVAFRVNNSRGTTNMINISRKKGLQVRTFDV